MEQDFAKKRLRTPLAEPSPVSQPSSLGLLLTGLITGMVIGLFIALLVYLSGALPPAPGHQPTTADMRAVETPEVVSAGGLTAEQQREAQRLQLEFYQELPNYEVVVDVTPVAGAVPRTPVVSSAATSTATPATTPDTSAGDTSSGDTATSEMPETAATTAPETMETIASGSAPVSAEALDPVSAALLEISNREARASAPAAPPATAASGGNFLLQAGAFQQQATATAQLNRLLGLGLNARVREEILPGRTLYLVQAGPYNTRDDMMQAERVLRSNSIDSMRITLSQP